ncbi:ribosomal protein S19e [Kipferlia bialata]|uniref:Ribosomal protein S19e n=1 Tax=Kipferlia bialata TaxID=797122 RepID=A0A9K3CQI7_9EUKA|nr:ribosomal protein S19e [Kipferlia bialata]|eukprot:g1376.t1
MYIANRGDSSNVQVVTPSLRLKERVKAVFLVTSYTHHSYIHLGLSQTGTKVLRIEKKQESESADRKRAFSQCIFSEMSVTLKNVNQDHFVKMFAAYLKRQNELAIPDWVDAVKTSATKQLSPQNDDWYYIRAASVLRRLYVRGCVGIGGFRTVYGGCNNTSVAPRHFKRASGNNIRTILQSFEKMGMVKCSPKGRVLTPLGQKTVDRFCQQLQ